MGKFEKLSNKIQGKQGISEKGANAIAASIGRKKYGKEEFSKMAAAGKKAKQYESKKSLDGKMKFLKGNVSTPKKK